MTDIISAAECIRTAGNEITKGRGRLDCNESIDFRRVETVPADIFVNDDTDFYVRFVRMTTNLAVFSRKIRSRTRVDSGPQTGGGESDCKITELTRREFSYITGRTRCVSI